MDVLLIYEVDILALTVISLENTDVIFLEATSLLNDSVFLARDTLCKKALLTLTLIKGVTPGALT